MGSSWDSGWETSTSPRATSTYEESMPQIDFRERGWATSSGSVDEELTKENAVVFIASTHHAAWTEGRSSSPADTSPNMPRTTNNAKRVSMKRRVESVL